MSPASYLTAPPRVAASMVAPMAVWIALAVFVAGLAAGLAVAVYRGICTWRLAKRTGGTFTAELDRISRVTGEIDEQLRRASEAGVRLGEAQERLRRSKARLDVQLAAVHEARSQLARVFWFVPGL
jgi:hypothetical protein